MRIWVDTGHLNSDSGAVGGGTTEVKRNDILADQVENFARWQGWFVGSTNENDAHTTLDERVADAVAYGASLFVSIHHDWTQGGQAVIYSNTNDANEVKAGRLADYINKRINQPDDGIPNLGIYADRRGLRVLKNQMPAVIVEAARVQDSYNVEQMARWIVQGICDFLGVIFKDKPSATPAPAPKPAPASASSPMLKLGSGGDWVVRLQTILVRKGANLKIDGLFGPVTEAAVKKFQTANHLIADGIVGPLTWAKLLAPVVAPAPKPILPTFRFGARGEWVVKLQRTLNSKGASLTADGIFGSLTDLAVKRFQRNRGLVVDGIVGPKTWAALGY